MKNRVSFVSAWCALLALSVIFGSPLEAQLVGEPVYFEIPAESEDLPGAGPIRRYPWFQSLWNARRTAWAQSQDQDRGAVVFLGDSITQGWEPRMREAFPGLKLANRGISGDTSRGLLVRLGRDVLMLQPAAVVLLIGTNDLEEGASPEVIGSNMELLLQAFSRTDPDMPVVLCEVFPSSAEMKRPTEQIQAINALYRQAAEKYTNVAVVGTFELFADEQGNARVEEFPDLLHPNAAGYAKWEEALRPVFAELGLGTTGRR